MLPSGFLLKVVRLVRPLHWPRASLGCSGVFNGGSRALAKHYIISAKKQLPFARNFAAIADPTTQTPAAYGAAKTLPEAFRRATLYSDERSYKLLRLPRSSVDFALGLWEKSAWQSTASANETPPFSCFMVDKDELTMMVSNDVYNEYCNTAVDNGIHYRLFTFDNVVLDPSLVGFMAVVTKALAENNISVLPYAAYSTDHIFVAEEDADRARAILENLSDSFPKNTGI